MTDDQCSDLDSKNPFDLVAALIHLARSEGIEDNQLARALLYGAAEVAGRSLAAEEWATSLRAMAAVVAPHAPHKTRN